MQTKAWLLPATLLAVSIGVGIGVAHLPQNYYKQHEWPVVALMECGGVAIYGFFSLFWALAPSRKGPWTMILGGLAVAVLSSIANSLLGVYVGIGLMWFGTCLHSDRSRSGRY